MIHVRNFWGDYWRWFAGIAAWLLLMSTAFVVPGAFTYVYALLWAGAGAAAAGVFVVGYLRYSKPTKDQVTHKREWNGIWVWFLAQAAILLLVLGMNFTFRLMNVDSAVFTEDKISQYRFAAAGFVTAFLQQLWLLWMWATRQVNTRRRIRDAALTDER